MKTINVINLKNAGICLLLLASCKHEDVVLKTTYTSNAKTIIDLSCAYAGCHSGPGAGLYVPAGSKNYTEYDSLALNLTNGKFTNRVLVAKDMPNPTYVPSGHPKTLSQSDLDILTSWKNDGYLK